MLCTTNIFQPIKDESTINKRLIPGESTSGGVLARVNATTIDTGQPVKTQVEQPKVEQPSLDTLEIFGDINQFHKEIQDIANMEQEISRRTKLPQPIKNANTWAAKYEALKQLSDEVDINTLNEAEVKTIHQAIKALEAELFCQMDDGKSTKEDRPTKQRFIKDQETPLLPPEPPPMMDECPSTPKPSKTTPDGSLLSEITRPMSPTNICDFPYFELYGQNNNEVTQEILNLPLLPSTTSRLRKISSQQSRDQSNQGTS
jgi:hypothetical protein